MPRETLIVTTSWDDGTITDLKLAELLEKYGVQGTFYTSRSPLDDLLPEQDIVAIDAQFEVGAHTLHHPDLIEVSLDEAKQEIEGSKRYLEALLGHSVSMFAYPYGKYNETTKEIVSSSGFAAARTCEPGGFYFPRDPYRWHINLIASNSSPLMALKIQWGFHLFKVSALLDWESRAKVLFDVALTKGGIYHLYGHSAEFETKNEWDKLERVFGYISNRQGVRYLTNGGVMSLREDKDKGEPGAFS